ncbi:transposase [Bacillus sp. FJAT-45350]|uniref:transposase n=1 Tax=Bacillus sp. FJAT-45350 TaxID=2011014 RepID=UPI000BB89A48|nr:transposase [Bacillus sp. FJAT-45350]
MKFILILGSMIAPVLMVFIQKRWFVSRFIFDIIALISLLVFGNIASTSIYEIIKNETVFMTNIHGILLKPLFLYTGSYIGVYLLYTILLRILVDLRVKG